MESFQVQEWPTHYPGEVKRNKIVDVLSNTMPIAIGSLYFGLAGTVIHYNGSSSSTAQRVVYEIEHYASSDWYEIVWILIVCQATTAFPYIFAFVVGGAVRSIALWRLQCGSRIGVLDLLFGSSSLTGTLTTQINLRSFRPLIVPLVLVWTFSMIGGQAMDRLVTFAPIPMYGTSTIQYMDTNSSLPAIYYDGSSSYINAPADALFQSSLAAPISAKVAPQDNWGHLKVPFLEYLPSYLPSSPQTWIPVNPSNKSIMYSSLLGIPMADLSTLDNATFVFTTSYWLLQCPVIGSTTTPKVIDKSWTNSTAKWGSMSSDKVNRCNKNALNISPRKINYFSWDNNGTGTFANCSMSTSYVDVMVSCNGLECSAINMRRSSGMISLSALTTLDNCAFEVDGDDIWNYFGSRFVGTTGNQGSSGNPSPLQTYFIDPAEPFNSTELTYEQPLYTIGNDSFAKTLAQLMNSYYTACIGSDAIFLDQPRSFASISGTSQVRNPNLTFSDTSAVVSIEQECFVYDKKWMIALIISTAVMVTAGLVKLIVDMSIITPELLMNVTTLTRNSPHLNLPPGLNSLGDVERSRLLEDVKVRFRDGLFRDNTILIVDNSVGERLDTTNPRKQRFYNLLI
jgi:hypothetical protein